MTKRKDDEDTSSTIYNAMDHGDPVLDFQKYINDNENIVDEVRSFTSTTRHRASTYKASTSMYSLTFCVRIVARTPPLEARSPGRRTAAVMLRTPPSTASHRPASHAHLRYTARNFENARHPPVTNQQRVHTPRKLGFALCCHSNATRASIANPPNSA